MDKINGKQLIEALTSGANQLSNNKERIDAMNVFPVPDGDTGSNMGSTAEYAANELKEFDDSAEVSAVSAKFARGMLLGARGNSGVILSQIFKGLAVGFENKKEVSQIDFVVAFSKAKEYAYKSVMEPVEGTILTIIRMVSQKLSETITASHTIEELFEIATNEAKKACELTPTLLPVLKEVGVTDSGAEGLLMMLVGMFSYFEGNPITVEDQQQIDTTQSFIGEVKDYEGEFGYCTETILRLKHVKSFDVKKFETALQRIGNSIVVVHDEDILKTHIHAVKPGYVLNFSQKFGEFLKIKIDNMTLQANESHKAKEANHNKAVNNEKEIGIGVISCNTGSGIIKEMELLGVNFIIESGQSSNPSAKDFIDAINSLNTDKIIILPNNKNIILAAQQVVQTTDKEVIVIPTKTQMHGIVAMMNFDRDGDFNDVRETMLESLTEVKTGQVTKAIRTTKLNGVKINENEFLSISDGNIISSHATKTEAAIAICKDLIKDDIELVSIYYGEDASDVDAAEVATFIETHSNADVEIKTGGQPIYDFLIAFE